MTFWSRVECRGDEPFRGTVPSRPLRPQLLKVDVAPLDLRGLSGRPQIFLLRPYAPFLRPASGDHSQAQNINLPQRDTLELQL